MAQQQRIVSGVPGRYARALYELAKETQTVDAVAEDLRQFRTIVEGSDELNRLVRSPMFRAEEQIAALQAIVKAVGTGPLASNFILLTAKNRRLSKLPEIIQAFLALIAAERGEVTAEVISAEKLSAKHVATLKDELTAQMGGSVMLLTKTDASLIGGLIVKIGSRMIDNSLKTKLQNLKMIMKGAG
ncbi:MAG: F0F1 ATP synthase subunit delta [Aestuariivirgaceae bacterium]